MRVRINRVGACLLIASCCVLWLRETRAQSAGATSSGNNGTHQSSSTKDGNAQATPPAGTNAPQRKARRVWDNEEIQKLQGGINVVGKPVDERFSSLPPEGGVRRSAAPRKQAPRAVRASAPQFIARGLSGTEYSNAAVMGRFVLVQIWTTWCPHCRADQEAVDRLASDFSSKLIVLAVNDGEAPEKVRSYLQSKPRACEVVLRRDTNLAQKLGAGGYPHYVVIDREGNLAGSLHGEAGEDGLRGLLKSAGIDED